jgi:hypothetical protein
MDVPGIARSAEAPLRFFMSRNISSGIGTYALASLATPVAVWFGGALFFVAKFGVEGFVVRILWHTLLCIYITLGSLLFSFPLLALRRVRVQVSITKQVLWPSVVCLGALSTTSLFLYTGRTTPDQAGFWPCIGFFLFGLALNGLVFLWLNWSWKVTV